MFLGSQRKINASFPVLPLVDWWSTWFSWLCTLPSKWPKSLVLHWRDSKPKTCSPRSSLCPCDAVSWSEPPHVPSGYESTGEFTAPGMYWRDTEIGAIFWHNDTNDTKKGGSLAWQRDWQDVSFSSVFLLAKAIGGLMPCLWQVSLPLCELKLARSKLWSNSVAQCKVETTIWPRMVARRKSAACVAIQLPPKHFGVVNAGLASFKWVFFLQ